MDNSDKLRIFYENEGEEDLRLSNGGVHYLEYLTAVKYLDKYLKPGSRVIDSCAGSGVYAFYLADKGHAVTAGDIVMHNVKTMQKKQDKNPVLNEIYCGDALRLGRFPDQSFDAVLLMGALYHLADAGDRKLAVNESRRVLKKDGVFVCTYMNRHAVIMNNASGSLDNIDEILTFLGDGREGIFYASTPGEMSGLMRECGLNQLCHVALDGISCLMYQTAKLIDETGLERWMRYHFAACEEPGLLGASYHNMLICKKI